MSREISTYASHILTEWVSGVKSATSLQKSSRRWKSAGRVTMTPTERVLALLEDVRPTGPNRWMARCPAHEDRTPSLSIREGDDGRILLHCFAGCGACDVVDALGLNIHDLFDHLPASGPDTPGGLPRRSAPPIPAKDALSILNQEALTVCFVAQRLAQGEPLGLHREHLYRATRRIDAIRESWMSAA